MFLLAIVADKIKTQPEQFDRDHTELLIEQIEIKYANKVLLDVGLCISFYDFVEVGDPFIYPAEGAAHQQVKFRMIVFRPFSGEILVGKISESTKDGLKVTLDFFENITIPSYLFPTPSTFNASTSTWTWKYGEEMDQQDFVLDNGEEVRFRVKTISFTGTKATAKGIQTMISTETHISQGAGTATAVAGKIADIQKEIPPALLRKRSSSIGNIEESLIVSPPMVVIGSINEDGLGMVSWWRS